MKDIIKWNWKEEKDNKRQLLYYKDELFARLVSNKKTKEDEEKSLEFFNKLKKDVMKLFNVKDKKANEYIKYIFYSLGYVSGVGFYALQDADRGHYSMIYGLPCDDIEEANLMALKEIIMEQSIGNELANREKYEKELQKRFDIKKLSEYSSALFFAEFDLEKWSIFFNNDLPEEIIKYYEDYLNDVCKIRKKGLTWKYVKENSSFIMSK